MSISTILTRILGSPPYQTSDSELRSMFLSPFIGQVLETCKKPSWPRAGQRIPSRLGNRDPGILGSVLAGVSPSRLHTRGKTGHRDA